MPARGGAQHPHGGKGRRAPARMLDRLPNTPAYEPMIAAVLADKRPFDRQRRCLCDHMTGCAVAVTDNPTPRHMLNGWAVVPPEVAAVEGRKDEMAVAESDD